MPQIPLTLRLVKGSKLTFSELDNNFIRLRDAINSKTDFYVTGGIYNPSTMSLDFTGNKGFTPFNVDVSSLTDTYVSGGVYDPNTGCVTFSTTSGYTFDVCGFVTGNTLEQVLVNGNTTGNNWIDVDISSSPNGVRSLDPTGVDKTITFTPDEIELLSVGNVSGFEASMTITDGWISMDTYGGSIRVRNGEDFFIDGSIGFKGLQYDVDYSSNYINRSLVDKEYVDREISGNTYWTSGSSGNYSIKVINDTTTDATGNWAVAEGFNTLASGIYSHSEGGWTLAAGTGSHSEGYQTIASGDTSHAEGYQTIALGETSHAEGENTLASGSLSHAEGFNTLASGNISHAEGFNTIASGTYSHAEGGVTTASGTRSHAEGVSTTASGVNSHAEGSGTLASGGNSHAQNSSTIAGGNSSHAGGTSSTATGLASFIHSSNSLVTGDRSVVLGGQNITGTTDDTVYVPYLNIRDLATGTSVNNLGVDSNGNVVVGSSGSTSVDTFTTGGTYDNSTALLSFRKNDSTTYDVDMSDLPLIDDVTIEVDGNNEIRLKDFVGSPTGGTRTFDGQIIITSGLTLSTLGTGTSINNLGIDSSGNIVVGTTGSTGVGGSGTNNYVARWTPNGSTLGESAIQDNGTTVSIGVTPSVNNTFYTSSSSQEVTHRVENGYISGTPIAGIFITSGTVTGGSNTGLFAASYGNNTLNKGIESQAASATAGINIGIVATALNGVNNYSAQLKDGTQTVGGGKFLRDMGDGKANWADITESDITDLGTYALVGTYTDSYIPRWNATANTLESGTIQDDGSTIGIGTAPNPNSPLVLTSNLQFGSQFTNNSTSVGAKSGIIVISNGVSSGINYGATTSAQNSTTQNIGLSSIATSSGSVNALGGEFVANGTTTGNKYSVRLSDGTEGTGKILMSMDINGNANWANITYSDISGTVPFTGNTSGDCISDLYVSNIHSCSPLNINPNNEGNVTIGQNSLIVDTTNDRIGIGKSSPTVSLDVVGDTKVSGNITTEGNLTVQGTSSTINGVNRTTYTFQTVGATTYTVGDPLQLINSSRYLKAIVVGQSTSPQNSTTAGSCGGEFINFYDAGTTFVFPNPPEQYSNLLSSTGTLSNNIADGNPQFALTLKGFTATGIANTTINWKVILEVGSL